jgi:hypothetical protein
MLHFDLLQPLTYQGRNMPKAGLSIIRRACFIFALSAVVLSLCGCSSKAKVSGTVTYNGKPLPAGKITFIGPDNTPSDPANIDNGRYTVSNAPVGECKIKVETSSLMKMAQNPKAMGGGSPVPAGMQKKMPAEMQEKMNQEKIKQPNDQTIAKFMDSFAEMFVPIPDEYENADKTPLRFTVKSGSNTYNPELKGDEHKINLEKMGIKPK